LHAEAGGSLGTPLNPAKLGGALSLSLSLSSSSFLVLNLESFLVALISDLG